MTYSELPTRSYYKQEYSRDFADAFDDIVGWESRSGHERDRLASILRKHGVQRVLDAACGTGFHLALLAGQGFELVGSDGAVAMVEKARINLAKRGIDVAVTVCDWRYLAQKMEGKFDAVLCLGDSFAHLLNGDLQLAVLRQFCSVLRPGGVLVIDHRNYDRVIGSGFHVETASGYCCCGDAPPRTLTLGADGLVTCRYRTIKGKEFSFQTFPVRKEHLVLSLKDTGFSQVETLTNRHADGRRTSDSDADFLIEIAIKEPSSTPVTA